MNLDEFTGGTPASKPWANIVAASIDVGELTVDSFATDIIEYKSAVIEGSPYLVSVGAAATAIPIGSFPCGVAIVGSAATGSLLCPSSAAIDAKLGTTTDGRLIWFDVVNRNNATEVSFVGPNAVAQSVPRAPTVTTSSYTRFWLTRIAGSWVPLNN